MEQYYMDGKERQRNEKRCMERGDRRESMRLTLSLREIGYPYHGTKRRDRTMADGHVATRRLVLPLDEDTSAQELEFDLDCFLAMSVEERYRTAIELSLALIRVMEEHGHREPPTVLQRPAR
jgi:hypothetical protein